MTDIKTKKLLYHLTDLKNLNTIFSDGLKPRKELSEFTDIADSEIIKDRTKHKLEEYVPFHWFSLNPFDGRVQKDYPNSDFVLITVQRKLAKQADWKIILRHPLAEAEITIFDYEEGFELIDWCTMNKREYSDPNCKSICMAECLSPNTVDVSQFFKIYTPTKKIENIVKEMLKKQSKSVDVVTNEGMFC